MPEKVRADHSGVHRNIYLRNKRRIFATQDTCALCGKPVDFELKYPHPLSACIDHIIPISRGGHPSDIDNMQLTHLTCNRYKSNKLHDKNLMEAPPIISNRNLPHSTDWINF